MVDRAVAEDPPSSPPGGQEVVGVDYNHVAASASMLHPGNHSGITRLNGDLVGVVGIYIQALPNCPKI